MWRGWRLGAIAASCCATLSLLTGCLEVTPAACTEIGAESGIGVTVINPLLGMDQVSLEVCRAGQPCLTGSGPLTPGSRTANPTCEPDGSCSAQATPDGTLVGFVVLPDLQVGTVQVRGSWGAALDPDASFGPITVAVQEVRPNGPQCEPVAAQGQLTIE